MMGGDGEHSLPPQLRGKDKWTRSIIISHLFSVQYFPGQNILLNKYFVSLHQGRWKEKYQKRKIQNILQLFQHFFQHFKLWKEFQKKELVHATLALAHYLNAFFKPPGTDRGQPGPPKRPGEPTTAPDQCRAPREALKAWYCPARTQRGHSKLKGAQESGGQRERAYWYAQLLFFFLFYFTNLFFRPRAAAMVTTTMTACSCHNSSNNDNNSVLLPPQQWWCWLAATTATTTSSCRNSSTTVTTVPGCHNSSDCVDDDESV